MTGATLTSLCTPSRPIIQLLQPLRLTLAPHLRRPLRRLPQQVFVDNEAEALVAEAKPPGGGLVQLLDDVLEQLFGEALQAGEGGVGWGGGGGGARRERGRRRRRRSRSSSRRHDDGGEEEEEKDITGVVALVVVVVVCVVVVVLLCLFTTGEE